MVNSINHSDIVLYKASHEYAKLGRMLYHILKLCDIDSIESKVYKDQAACVV